MRRTYSCFRANSAVRRVEARLNCAQLMHSAPQAWPWRLSNLTKFYRMISVVLATTNR